MDFSLNSWGDIATFLAILSGMLGVVAWLAKTWIDKAVAAMGDQITPHLTNDDTSVARYAHEARDAARAAHEEITIVREDLRDVRTDIRDLNQTIIGHIGDRSIHHYHPLGEDAKKD